MADDFIRIKNPCEHTLHPLNAVAEYSFGALCEDHYKDIKSKQTKGYQESMDQFEKVYRIAIDKFGLTLEMSTEGGIEANKIWDKVETEIKGAVHGPQGVV